MPDRKKRKDRNRDKGKDKDRSKERDKDQDKERSEVSHPVEPAESEHRVSRPSPSTATHTGHLGAVSPVSDDDGGVTSAPTPTSHVPALSMYNPGDYAQLSVGSDVQDIFQYIREFRPRDIELPTSLRPFIPDFLPAVGDIDAFIKISRPDGDADKIGLVVLDEPCTNQSEPDEILPLIQQYLKPPISQQMRIKSIEHVNVNEKAIDRWIQTNNNVKKNKPAPTVHYSRTMPDIDTLMAEWPPEFEDLLKMVNLPSSELDCSLKDYVDIVCAILDIPIYKSRVQSLHVLFTLYSEFKNSQHFRALAQSQGDAGLYTSQQADLYFGI